MMKDSKIAEGQDICNVSKKYRYNCEIVGFNK